MSGMLSGRRAVVIVCGLLQGLVVFSLTSRFFVNSQRDIMLFIGKPKGRSRMISNVNSHLDHSRARIPACSLTAALVYRCFSSNVSTTAQGAIVKLHGACSELCTLFI